MLIGNVTNLFVDTPEASHPVPSCEDLGGLSAVCCCTEGEGRGFVCCCTEGVRGKGGGGRSGGLCVAVLKG